MRADPTPWPCDRCGELGVRNVFSRGYCGRHLSELFGRLEPAVFDGIGVGLLSPGPWLTCNVCGASWHGDVGDDCSWCIAAVNRLRAWQAELTLAAPDVDPADRRYGDTMRGWADRLAVAVRAGLVDEHRADRAWRKAVRDVAA